VKIQHHFFYRNFVHTKTMSSLKPVFVVYVHQPRLPQNFIVYIITECPALHSNKSHM